MEYHPVRPGISLLVYKFCFSCRGTRYFIFETLRYPRTFLYIYLQVAGTGREKLFLVKHLNLPSPPPLVTQLSVVDFPQLSVKHTPPHPLFKLFLLFFFNVYETNVGLPLSFFISTLQHFSSLLPPFSLSSRPIQFFVSTINISSSHLSERRKYLRIFFSTKERKKDNFFPCWYFSVMSTVVFQLDSF